MLDDVRHDEPGLVHIGYAKALSSWLQRFLFASPPFALVDRRAVVRDLINAPTLGFEPGSVRDALRAPIAAAARSGMPVVSEERLCGDPHSGGYDSKELADRLVELFPDSRVLVVVREQRSMIASTYHQYLRDGGALRAPAYLVEHTPVTVPGFRFSHFEYHHLVEAYQSRFGTERVRVLPMELFRQDPGAFVDGIARFAGVELAPGLPFDQRVKVSHGAFRLLVRRQYNRVSAPSSINPAATDRTVLRRALALAARLDPVLSKPFQDRVDARLDALIADRVGDRYGASNRRLEQLTGLELGRLGYMV